MSGFEIRGWCPGALQPMASADGLVVRIRPPLGRLTTDQARGLAAAADACGSGQVELTSRANLQIRGVSAASHPALLGRLSALGLTDADPAIERRRNLIITPFHRPGDGTLELAAALTESLRAAPALPAKFGLALDCGPAPVLQSISADIRIERAQGGTLLIRPDGHATGQHAMADQVPQIALAFMRWFVATGIGRDGRGRMRDVIARTGGPAFFNAITCPARGLLPPAAGPVPGGCLAAAAFGILSAASLAILAERATELRVTPWRALFLPGANSLPDLADLITDPDDAVLRISACTGAPGCPQARAETRPLARALGHRLPPDLRLHVSGCAKGCAHPRPADITLTATPDGFALARNARAADRPERTGLSAAALLSSPDLLIRPKDAP